MRELGWRAADGSRPRAVMSGPAATRLGRDEADGLLPEAGPEAEARARLHRHDVAVVAVLVVEGVVVADAPVLTIREDHGADGGRRRGPVHAEPIRVRRPVVDDPLD